MSSTDDDAPQAPAGRQRPGTSSPDGVDTVAWLRADGTVRAAHACRGLLEARLWEAAPIRTGAQYQNRRNQHGLYFWARTGEHLWYESALELASLVELDHRGDAVRVAAQPFRLLFRTGSPATYHDPDFFALHAGGDQVLYDVKPARRIDEAARRQFEQTARVCELIGWRHEVLVESSPTRASNLTFLRPARLPRYHPDPRVTERLLGVFDGGRPIGQGAAMIDRRHPVLVMPHIRHLIWHRRLRVDLEARLDFDAAATTSGQEADTCCG